MSKKNMPKKNAYQIKNDVAYFTKNRLPAFILAGLIIFWTIASVLGIIAFARGEKTSPKGMVKASAQTVEDYQTNTYKVDLYPLNGVAFSEKSSGILMSFSNNPSIIFNGSNAYLSYPAYSNQSIENVGTIRMYLLGGLESELYDFGVSTNQIDINTDYHIPYTVTYTIGIDEDYYNFYIGIRIDFADKRGEELRITSWSCTFSTPTDDIYATCPYFGSTVTSGHEPLSFTEKCYGVDIYTAYDWYYQAQNYDNAYQYGYNNGYKDGKGDGYSNGYNKGFTDGATDGNDYTFTGLISSVIDVPIQAFTSLFNFDLLGVNLANFFFALLTVAILLAFVRMLL